MRKIYSLCEILYKMSQKGGAKDHHPPLCTPNMRLNSTSQYIPIALYLSYTCIVSINLYLGRKGLSVDRVL